jgi:hypothetical protein
METLAASSWENPCSYESIQEGVTYKFKLAYSCKSYSDNFKLKQKM